MLETQFFNVYKFDRFGMEPAKQDKVTLIAGSDYISSQSQSFPIHSLGYSHNSKYHFCFFIMIIT